MARSNDNLFTKQATAFDFLGAFGWMRARFKGGRLAELAFLGDWGSGGEWVEDPLAGAFALWVRRFARLDRNEQWACLQPGGSVFQRRVWRELVDIPSGGRRTYGGLAEAIGRPGASRALGSAVGTNPIMLLIPCHRVLPKSGGVGNYRYGSDRKRALLDAERESGSDQGTMFVRKRILSK